MKIERILAPLLLLFLGSSIDLAQTDTTSRGARTIFPPVLVELFTSEGCLTCPPADKLLTDLERNQPVKGVQVIALSEHVDYWNRLGWKDPFSSAQFSQRQTDYSQALGIDEVYTPQMIVDGRAQFVGSNLSKALDAIVKAAGSPKANVSLSIKIAAANSIAVAVRIESVPEISRGDKADVMLAVTEGSLQSKVSRGENSGRELAHSAVTRKLVKIGTVQSGAFTGEVTIRLDSEWKRKNMKAVAFVQERTARRVIGASAAAFADAGAML